MGPDPFNMPTVGGAQNNANLLQQSVNQLAPLATQWHGPTTGVAIPTIPSSVQAKTSSGGVVQQFGHWLGGVTNGIGHIAVNVGGWLAKNTVNMAEAPFKFAYDVGTGVVRNYEEGQQNDQLNAKVDNLTKLWHAGNINDSQYSANLKELMGQQDKLSQDIQLTGQRLQNSKAEGINTAATVLTLLVGPAGEALAGAVGVGAAARFLASTNANAFLGTTERALSAIAGDEGLFNSLNPVAQKALQQATAEVVSNSAGMSAGQIARATAVNVALKYPVYYNYMSTTGNSLYNQLDSKQYGAATRQMAFNAALLLSGGPIGWALQKGGKAVGAVASRVFQRGTFLDTLSKAIGEGGDNMNGDAAGLYKSITSLPQDQQAEVVRQISAVEATNMAATGGDPVAAAVRVIKGMQSYEGISLSQFTHDEVLQNMTNFAKAQRMATAEADRTGLGPIAVGRVDARALNSISEAITKGDGFYAEMVRTAPQQAEQVDMSGAPDFLQPQGTAKGAQSAEQPLNLPTGSPQSTADRLQAWETLKQQNPNQAWANNTNLDSQIKSLINKYDDPAQLDNALKNINASFKVGNDKFDPKVASELQKMGYIPIQPSKIDAPFQEGSGKVATQFASKDTANPNAGADFFTKSVQPLPVLSWMGDALTAVGLSPNASTERVYQIFNDNLSKNLEDSGVLKIANGEDASQASDTTIKRLSEYAKNPTRGKIVSKMPITDLRMLTTADVQKALDLSMPEARKVQDAITRSYVQVPLAVRGIGDRLVDKSYQFVGPAARRYLRVQGAARFAWNPFFQYLRVVPKTETLASFEGGGFINALWNGRLGELGNVRNELRSAGMLDEKGSLGDVVSGEAISGNTSTEQNLYKKLLPAQENSVAGLIMSQAERMNMDYKTYINTYPQQVRDTIQAIAQYDRKANFLNSPMMRTLNVAFFPLRFETKVATIMAKSLAQTSLMTQVSVVNGMMRFHSWMNSAEGQAWYARNTQAISLFEYITPAAELNNVFESLLPGHDHSLGNFGELGGLPFGWIPQLLDSEGITHFNQPAVNPNTGEIYGQYIPTNQRGQVATAIQDLLSSLFTWPGANLGLPSKTKATATVAYGLVGGSKTKDAQYTTPAESSLNPQQRGYQDIVAQMAGTPINNQPTQPPAPFPTAMNTPGINVPKQPTPAETAPTGRNSGASKTPKLKKGQFKPELLPGQSQLGQLP